MKLSNVEYCEIEDRICREVERKMADGHSLSGAIRGSIENEFIKLGLIENNTKVFILNPNALVGINTKE